jgi:hypothetical protein
VFIGSGADDEASAPVALNRSATEGLRKTVLTASGALAASAEFDAGAGLVANAPLAAGAASVGSAGLVASTNPGADAVPLVNGAANTFSLSAPSLQIICPSALA